MDRRKLMSRNPLHRQLQSSSQLSVTRSGSDLSKSSSITRSISDIENNENIPSSRKRKNSENEDDGEGDSARAPSPVISLKAKKKKKNIIDDEDKIDSDDEKTSPKQATQKTKDSVKKKSDNSDKDEDNEAGTSSGGSYIRGVLEAIDKSPAKLSQSSSNAVDKYRKLNLRTPIRPKIQKSISKAIAGKKKEKSNEKKDNEKEIADPRLQKKTLKNILPSPASKKRVTRNEPEKSNSSDSDAEEMSFSFSDTDNAPSKKSKKESNAQVPKGKISKASKSKEDSIEPPSTPPTSPTSKNKVQNRALESPELSPLKSFASPEKVTVNVTTRKKRTIIQTDDKLINFLNAAGITLCSGDSLHIASEDPREVVHKMKEILGTDSADVDEIMTYWNNYIDDEENLKKSLLEMKIETDDGVAICSKAVSLSRLLLQVPQLQIDVLNSLFKKLINAVLTTDSSDDAPWSLQMLQQFRFLELLVDQDVLISRLEELLSSSPEWFQREVIVFIPDIVTDAQHRTTAEMLIKIMDNNRDLTNIILDCIYNFILGKDYREELREQVLGLLERNFDKNTVPAITRFILNACSTEAIALKCLNVLRTIDMSPAPKDKLEECYTNQSFMVSAIKVNIQLFKEVAQAAINLVKTVTQEAKPLDLIVSILLYEATAARKKIIETTLQSHIKDGYFKTSLLKTFYSGYKEVATSFQFTALNLALTLLKADSPSHVEFGIEWVRNLFTSQSDTPYKQREIMERLLNLMADKDKTVKNALEVLCRMANDETERKYLQQHAGFLRSFLEKIDNLQFDEVSTLYHLLHGLCTQSELIYNILNDDLAIIMQKQLCSSKVLTKCKGVLGAVMAIKHLASNNGTCEQAQQLLRKTQSSIKGCLRSQSLFHDQLAQVIAAPNNIDSDFLTKITDDFEEQLIATCLIDTKPEGTLVPTFGLNDPSEAESYYVNFGSGKAGATVPVLFRLLRICNLQISDNLESINAILGCPILMPEDLDMPEPSTADYMIHCINWFREIISGFVTQEDKLLREQVLKRLESLMSLQGEFVTMVAMCESRYQPPPCYFHHFPVPQFNRLDLKMGKKGGKKGKKKDKKEKEKEKDSQLDSTLSKSIILPEWENWEVGSELTVKNPAYFRQMDIKIIHLLDVNMDTGSSSSASGGIRITIAQVCFIVKELLGMFQNQASESFMRDLIDLLPKLCSKLRTIIADLRRNESTHEKEAVRLFLCLFITIFSWKEFQSSKHLNLLRDGLRTLAGMINTSSASLRTCKELVAEAYKYFESLADIASEISLAVALVKMCGCLMKHSTSFTKESMDKQAKMAYGFLCLEWNESHSTEYKAAVKELIKIWIENEPDPLDTICSVMEWLPEQSAALDRPNSKLTRMPAITKVNFHMLLKQLFAGLVKGIDISLGFAESDPERIKIWSSAAMCLDKMSHICKTNKNTIYLMLFLRYSTILYQTLLTNGMKVLEANVKYQTEEVLNVIKFFQRSGRFLRDIFCTARKEKNVSLLKLIPLAKSRRERFIYRVKGMLTANNSLGAFWMGNLLNKDLDGEEIESESSEELTTGTDVTAENNNLEETGSEIYDNTDNSDSDGSVDIDGD